MKEELVLTAFYMYNSILDSNELVIFKKKNIDVPDYLLGLYDRTIYDNADMRLLECEKDMMVNINEETKVIRSNKEFLGLLDDEINNAQNRNSQHCFEEIFDLKNNNSNSNNKYSEYNNKCSDRSLNYSIKTNHSSSVSSENFFFSNKFNLSNISSTNNINNTDCSYLNKDNIIYQDYRNTRKTNIYDVDYKHESSNQDDNTYSISKFIVNCDDDCLINDIKSDKASKLNEIDPSNISSYINKNSLIYYIGIPEHFIPPIHYLSFHMFIGASSHNLFMLTYNVNIKTSIIFNSSNNYYENQVKNFKVKNDFLKSFNPKFIKKELLDKVIIRKFNKYLRTKYKRFIEISNNIRGKVKVQDKDKKDDITNSIFSNFAPSTSFLINDKREFDMESFDSNKKILDKNNFNSSTCTGNEDDSIDFFIKYIKGEYIPPFKYKQEYYKSYCTKYLMFIFRNTKLKEIYNEFIEEIGSVVIKYIVDQYDVITKQPKTIESLKYYISNLNNLYNFNFVNSSRSINSISEYIKENTKVDSVTNIIKIKWTSEFFNEFNDHFIRSRFFDSNTIDYRIDNKKNKSSLEKNNYDDKFYKLYKDITIDNDNFDINNLNYDNFVDRNKDYENNANNNEFFDSSEHNFEDTFMSAFCNKEY